MPNLVTLNIRAKLAYATTRDEPQPQREVTEIIRSLVDMLEVKYGEDPSFLPQLQHISITLSRHIDKYKFPYLTDQDDLVRTLQSRWHVESHLGLARLKTFKYWISARDLQHIPTSDCTLRPQSRDALQLLEDDGMVISIRVRSKLVRPDIPYLRVDFGHHSA
ncbi:hypothetical protein BDZ89DRAFT_1138438 [Hymenopellis radicata]|nr:hypothetical protein BDZ89DRAFT_1138438 [Hymenopellis radicata]